MTQQQYELDTHLSGYAHLLRKRQMGKISFWSVRFKGQAFQLKIVASSVENYTEVVKISTGSCVWINGVTCLTPRGEFTIDCKVVSLVSACKHSMSDKHGGLQAGKRYADRLAGLLDGNDSFELFDRISTCTQKIREFLWKAGHKEFSTGTLSLQWEAGAAGAFSTLCNANGKRYNLSLTSEIKLRKLQAAGYDQVFEIFQSFRNEGIDTMHSPEFSLLEVYRAGAECEDMMRMLEEMLRFVTVSIYGNEHIPLLNGSVDMSSPFSRVDYYDACVKYLKVSREQCTLQNFIESYPQHFQAGMSTFTWVFKVINKLLAPHFLCPTFVTHIPSGISPLVKLHPQDPGVTKRAALVIQSIDIADVYADESDANTVRASMEQQFHEVGTPVNDEYIRVLEYGVPPSGSIGMGMNRLFLLLRGNLPRNIKETILFPL